VRAQETAHTVPSLGYVVFERRRKLKTEFAELTGQQIRDLRLAGTDVTFEHRIPLVGYTGDTSPQGLDQNPLFFEPQILITEMTFVAPSHRKNLIHKHGHMHLDDIVERQDRFQNEIVILGHLSTRYSGQQVEKMVKRQIPDMLDGRLRLWI